MQQFEQAYAAARAYERERKNPGGNVHSIQAHVRHLEKSNRTLQICDRSTRVCNTRHECHIYLLRLSIADPKEACAKKDWKDGTPVVGGGLKNHKELCAESLVQMGKVVEVQRILMQFPWGRVETDGTFADAFAKARYNVLGARGFGYWSQADVRNYHLEPREEDKPAGYPTGPPGSAWRSKQPSEEEYMHGYQLLTNAQLSDAQGRKLDFELIPVLSFDDRKRMPCLATEFPGGIFDWSSWYSWRGLSLSSPAALLMHFPLSVYRLLTHVLGVIDLKGMSPTSRRKLCIHYIGVEIELNFIPIFSELALLLPYTDITMCFYGISVHDILLKAKKLDKPSIAGRGSTMEESVYSYKAPKVLGGSTFDVQFAQERHWGGEGSTIRDDLIPDVLIALNAGLLSYNPWQRVIAWAHLRDIPFGVTEYCESSAVMQTATIPSIVQHCDGAIVKIGGPYTEVEKERMRRIRDYPIEFNPFQRPGQRQLPVTRTPNVPNGFTIQVVR